MLVDSHCHFNFPELSGNISSCLELMQTNDVGLAVCVGVRLEEFGEVISLAEKHDCLYASVGLHPEITDSREPSVLELVKLGAHPRIIAIGETGLDYYWHKDAPQWQRERFKVHIEAAREVQKPLIVHNRDATHDVLKIMQEQKVEQIGGVMHCFTESWEMAQSFLEMGLYISFSGIVTFKNAKLVREAAMNVPLDRLLIETDSPYLAPVPFRGKTNQPAYVKHVAEEIARLRNISFEEVAEASTRNFFKLFGINNQFKMEG